MAVDDLAALELQHVAWLLVIEGVPWAYTTQSALAGSGASSWIGTDEGARVVRSGLLPPDSLSTAIKIGAGDDTGMLEDDGAEFRVIDSEGDLISLFAQPVAPETLGARLAPTDDPAPAFGIDTQGGAVALWGRNVGHEAIGPGGERRYYSCIPGALPGPDHAALNDEAALCPVEVTDAPQFREGRRVALYLLRRDPWSRELPEHSNWASWAEQIEGGALVWWGTLRRGSCSGREWRLPCAGPASWLAKQLNSNAPSEWRRASPVFSLSTDEGQREDQFAVVLTTYDSDGADLNFHGSDVFTSSFGASPNVATVVTLISNTVAGLLGAAGPDGVYQDQFSATADFDAAYASVRIDAQGLLATGASMRICMHAKVWALLGWDPAAQVALVPAADDDPRACLFQPGEDVLTPTPVAPPGPGYWTLYCDTWAPDLYVKNDYDNGGATRYYQPLSSAGALVLSAAGGQELSDGYAPAAYIEGQLAQPPTPGAAIDGVPVDTMRWALFGATIRRSEDADAEEWRGVARIEWASSGMASLTQTGAGDLRFRVMQWYDPRYFGYAGRLLAGDLTLPATAEDEVSLRWVPLGVLGYNANPVGLDNVVRVLPRLLLSTGTASWSGGVLVPGVNAHPDADGVNDDAEIADLGLAIPAALVDLVSIEAAAAANPGGVSSALNRVRLAYVGPVASEDVLKAILGPRHWSLCLRGNKYGVFAWTDALTIEDVDVAIGTSDVADDAGPPQVDLRPFVPIDKASVTFGQAELQIEASTFTHAIASRDAGRAARNGRHVVELQARGLPAPSRWIEQEDAPPENWRAAFSELWATRVGPWCAAPMISVKTRVRVPKSLACQVGSVVRLTNPWPATTTGQFGLVNALGRITAVSLDTRTLAADIEVLLHGRDAVLARRFAPVARIVDDVDTAEERYDPVARVLYCQADAFERGSSSDVAYFAEPDGLDVGGAAEIEVWQWSGTAWSQTLTGTVASVDTTEHTITLSAASGTFRDRSYAVVVMRPYLDQAEGGWVRTLYLPTTSPAGTFDGGAEDGFQFTK